RPSFHTITGVPVCLARSTTFRDACANAASTLAVSDDFLLFLLFIRLFLRYWHDTLVKSPIRYPRPAACLLSDQVRGKLRGIVQPPVINERAVQAKQVANTCGEPPANIRLRDVVASLPGPVGHAGHGQVGAR